MSKPKPGVTSQMEPEIAAAVKENYAACVQRAAKVVGAAKIRKGASLTDNYQLSFMGTEEPFGLRIRIGRKGKRKLIDLHLDPVGLSVLRKYVASTNPHGSVSGSARVETLKMPKSGYIP